MINKINSAILKITNAWTIVLGAAVGLSSYWLNLFNEVEPKAVAIVAVLSLDTATGILSSLSKGVKFNVRKFVTGYIGKLLTYVVFLFVFAIMQKGFSIDWIDSVVFGTILTAELLSALKNSSDAGLIKLSLFNKIAEKITKHEEDTI